MEKTLLYQVLATFTVAEWKSFGRFLRSPYFNKKERMLQLTEYFQQCFLEKQVATEEGAYKAIFKGKFDVVKLRLDLSELLELVELFLEIQAYQPHPTRLASLYRKRGLEKHFLRTLREAEQKNEKQPFRFLDYYTEQHAIETEQHTHFASTKRMGETNLQKISGIIDIQIVLQKLKHACMMRSHQTVMQVKYDFGLLGPILQYVEQSEDMRAIPAIALYYHCYHYLTNEHAYEHFQAFRETLTQHVELIPIEERRTLFLAAINFGIRKINQLDQKYFNETLNLYRTALAQNLLLEGSHLSRFAYNNIIGLCLRMGEMDWAEQFAAEYKDQIEPKYRQATFCLNAARISYYKGNFGEALVLLQQADYKDLISSMSAKILQMKIYFETSEYSLLDAHLESMSSYLRRQRDIGYHRNNYKNIIRLTRRLANLNLNADEDVADFRKSVIKADTLTERDWLLDQLTSMGKGAQPEQQEV